jgi:hypothetical protein
MPISANKEEVVFFEKVLEGFSDNEVLAKAVTVTRFDQTTMERTNDTIWRPMPYVLPSYDGIDQSANFNTKTQLSVPVNAAGFKKSVPFSLNAVELRDMLQQGRLSDAARQRLGSDVNLAVLNAVAIFGTLVSRRTVAATGFDDVAQLDSIMNELGVDMENRRVAYQSRDYNGMASNLAGRQTINQKPTNAYERAMVNGDVAGFEVLKLNYGFRLTSALGVGVTINDATAANRRYVPRATSTALTGETANVDNRFMTITIAVTSGTVKVGDAFTIAGVNSVHMITKQDTGQPKTFRITGIVSGAGGSGVIQFSPPIISADSSPTQAEIQYKNCTATPANGAALTFLNTTAASANPFWKQDCIELLPSTYAVPTGVGMEVMRGSTDSGMEVIMTKQGSIDNLNVKYRFDCPFGVGVLNPEMCGIQLFNQA